jgi:opacity protein-like surface antigen
MRMHILFALAVLALAPAAHAQQKFYVGGSLSHSNLRAGDYGSDVQDAYGTLIATSDAYAKMDAATGGRIFGAMTLTSWLALELDYTSAGKIASGYDSISIHGAILGHSETNTTGKLDAYGIAVVARTPSWEGFSGHARAGVARTRLRNDTQSCFFGNFPPAVTCASQSTTENQTTTVAGLGVDYKITHCWEARLGWERYFGVGKDFGFDEQRNIAGHGKFDVDLFTVGAYYRF